MGSYVFTFLVSGRLWRNSLVMQDQETGSYWSHVTGEALLGQLQGEHLSTLPGVQTTWAEWFAAHPDTRVLKKERDYSFSAYEDYFKDPLKSGLFRTHWLMDRLPGKTLVHGVRLGNHALAVPDSLLRQGEFLQTRLGAYPVVVYRATDGGVRAYLAEVRGKALSFRKDRRGQIRDRETQSVWNLATGYCAEGTLAGNQLPYLPTTVAYWFAWSTYFPGTRVAEK